MANTTADKLALLEATKADLKAALAEKGQTVGDVFSTYPAAVRAIETGGGTATIQVNFSKIQNTDYGIYYVSPDGISSFKDLSTAPFSIQVKNNSFILPSVPTDMDQAYIRGDLSLIENSENYSALTNHRQYLIFVSGDGEIRQINTATP